MERMDFGLYYDTQSNSFLECDIREIQIAGRLAADELIEGGAFQIVLSTDVNIGDGGWFGKVKNWAKTMLNRVFRKQKVDEVIEEKAEKGMVTGWSVGKLFDGRYYDRKNHKRFDEKSFTLEIRGIDDSVARQIAVDLVKKFDQESVLLIDLESQKSRLVAASIKITKTGQIIRGIRYQELHHGEGSTVWWLEHGKMMKHISKGTMQDMHHQLAPHLNMDMTWRGRSDKGKGGMVTVLPPVAIYSRGAEDIPNNILKIIEKELRPRTIVVDTLYGLSKVAFVRTIEEISIELD